MKKVECIIQAQKVPELLSRLDGAECFFGVTQTAVRGCGRQRGHAPQAKAVEKVRLREFVKLEFVVPHGYVKKIAEVIVKVNRTGKRGVGDGKIFISDLKDVIRISSRQRGKKGIV